MEHIPTSPTLEKSELIDKLTKYHIPIHTWGTGQAKTVDHLLSEINVGETILVEDMESKQLIREFSFLAIVATCCVDGNTYQLIEDKQVFSDGRVRVRGSEISVGEKIKQGEHDIDLATKRALQEELGIESGFTLTEHKHIKEEVDSVSYPGLMSRRNKFSVSAAIDVDQYDPSGYVEVQSDKTTFFVWRRV